MYIQVPLDLVHCFVGRKAGWAYDLDASSIDHGCTGLCGPDNGGAIESCAIELDRNSSRKPDAR